MCVTYCRHKLRTYCSKEMFNTIEECDFVSPIFRPHILAFFRVNGLKAHIYVVVLVYPWFKFLFFCFKIIIIHYHTQKQKIKFKPRIKLNHNIYHSLKLVYVFLAAFATHNGLYELLTMPFGLVNSGASFQRLMGHILRGLEYRFALIYIDDIIIFSKSIDEHLVHWRKESYE